MEYDPAKDLAFQLIDDRLNARQRVTELEVQELIVQQLSARGLEFDHAPIVAFGDHASDGHYAPGAQTDRALEWGRCVLIDLWAGFKDRPMADITWVGFAGEPTAEYLRAWEAVRDARDRAVQLLTTKSARAGWEVDRAALRPDRGARIWRGIPAPAGPQPRPEHAARAQRQPGRLGNT